MIDSARFQAVHELIVEIFKDDSPADKIINEYIRARRYIGSQDRRFITEKTWDIIRNRMKLSFDMGSSKPRDVLIAYLKDNLEFFDGSKYGLPELTDAEKSKIKSINEDTPYPSYVEAEMPEWLYLRVKDKNVLKAMQYPATADFRANNKHIDVLIENMKTEGFDVYRTPYSHIGFRSDKRINLINCLAYKDGQFDVQDEGSQIVSILVDASKEEKIIDYCAGAGGKSLTLSYLLNNKGKIDAHDLNWHRLEQIKPRIEKLEVSNINIIREVSDFNYDKFIIDAPCSGMGTLRRSPDAKYRLTEEKLQNLSRVQLKLIENGYKRTKIGGKIIYITCSILEEENENIINSALKDNSGLKLVDIKSIWDRKISQPYPSSDEKMLRISPYSTNTDGYFIAILEKIK